ncbi:HpaII family restriction endonuclease [Robertkochia flava]|uniref:HpaII family restriction endonuclease n=1 Tax=Robertkochia flava TaxID=3447986 RepID=UPI001CC967BD|nr:HpaII family restriction endonuclease [Robertkochia marina]
MITGNKGEWSEIYVFLKLLGDGFIIPGDNLSNPLPNQKHPLINITRKEQNHTLLFSIKEEEVLVEGPLGTQSIKRDLFRHHAYQLLEKILYSGKGAFSVPSVERFMHSTGIYTLKAKSSKKTDINLRIHDPRSGTNPEMGFSIKSQLGNPSTLLNAGKTTNFVYEIRNLALIQEELNFLNNISSSSKIMDRLNWVLKKGGQFQPLGPERQSLSDNLQFIDSDLNKIIGELILLYYQGKSSSINELSKILSNHNPLAYSTGSQQNFYDYKIKKFLFEVALGMMPAKPWTGTYDATGGYIIVKEKGELICYHNYDKNQFENYLFNNTRLETASSSRHDFGYIYTEGTKTFLKLNLQIRFIK